MPISQNIHYICSKHSSILMKLNKIKNVLDERGSTQTWLAKKLGKSFSTVNAYCCNRYQPDLTTLLEIAGILKVDLKDLITDEHERV